MNQGPDVLGIVSIVAAVLAIILHLATCCGGMIIPFISIVLIPMVWLFILVGLVLGIVGYLRGRAVGTPVASLIGTIINVLLVLEQVILVVVVFAMGGLAVVMAMLSAAAGA